MVDLSRLMQDAAILEVIDKSADEASILSAQNSYQAMRIEELEREVVTLRARLNWAAHELLVCDYGDNDRGPGVIGWIVYGRPDPADPRTQLDHHTKRRIYGRCVDIAIDAAIDAAIGGDK